MTKTLKRDRIVCKDGFSMSVQASEYHYSSPRITDAPDYETVEVGFPSEEEILLNEYVEGFCPGFLGDTPFNDDIHDTYTSSVYPYVPAHVVFEVIDKHGGMVSGGPLPPIKHRMSRVNKDKFDVTELEMYTALDGGENANK